MKNFKIRLRQIDLGFDRSQEQNLAKISAFIDSMIAQKDRVTVDDVVGHFFAGSDGLPKLHILNLSSDLFIENKINFVIDGKIILPDNIKAFLLGHIQYGSEYVNTKQLISTIETCFSDPDRWKHIEIVKPETVGKSVLIEAQLLGEKLFKDVAPLKQNSLCKYLRKHLRAWENKLTRYWEITGTGKYPGAGKIQQGLDLLQKLLNVYDPCKFLQEFNTNKDRIRKASDDLPVLKHFFNNQIYVWDKLIESVEEFTPNRQRLEEDPNVKKALKKLLTILSDLEPSDIIDKIEDDITVVKKANDLIVAEQVAAAKVQAIKKLDEMIDEIRKTLDQKKADSDTRNNALFPLQDTKRKINIASYLQYISDCLDNAEDLFESTMDDLA